MTSAEREELLAANRRARDELRAKEAAKKEAAKKGDGAPVGTAGDPDGGDADGGDAGGEGLTRGRSAGGAGERPDRSAAPAAQRSWRRAALALGALALILAVATGVLAYLYAAGDDGLGPDSGLGQSALQDGQRYAEQIVTYSAGDYSALDKQIRAISTPEFADRYIQSSQEARKGNDEAKASSTATARAAGLQSISADKAEVLVALDQKITSPELPSAGEEGLEYQRRVVITLARDGDRWIVADLAQV